MLNFSCCGPSSDTIEGGANWQVLPTTKLKIYTFAELKKATGNFGRDEVSGRGRSKNVFKGWVDVKTLAPSKWGSGMLVAVKKCSSESMQCLTEMQSEVTLLKRLPHPNVIKLLGYCLKGKERFLVYEYMQKGSLTSHMIRITGRSSIKPISWDTRLKILIGAARGLNFLHCAEDQIIHRDFKLSNILLDGNYNAKISDFGLAVLGPKGEKKMHVDTPVAGTRGYIAPEYIRTGELNVKSDVYSFGAVLLELLTGLRLSSFEHGEEKQNLIEWAKGEEKQNLIEWAKPLLPHRINLKTIMDVQMEGQYSIDAAHKAAQLTLKCLGDEPETRPSMKEVVEALEKIDKMKDAPKKSKIGLNQHTANY